MMKIVIINDENTFTVWLPMIRQSKDPDTPGSDRSESQIRGSESVPISRSYGSKIRIQ